MKAYDSIVGELSPSLEELSSIDGGYDLALLSAEVSSDLETPISAFMKLRDGGPCCLLESAEQGQAWGRYSFLGFDPAAVVKLEDGRLTVSDPEGERELGTDPIRAVFEMVQSKRVFSTLDALPFAGGAVGYFGYDTLPYMEKAALSSEPAGAPEMMFMFPRRLVVFDHLRCRMILCVLAELTGAPGALEGARADIADMASRLERRLPREANVPLAMRTGNAFTGVSSNVTRERFEAMVERAREYILAGDAYQVVVSQRFTRPIETDALSVYRCLRAENPSPYMFYIELPGITLVGSSPEPVVTSRGGQALIRPIAGTRRRGSGPEDDAAMERELRADPKENAEHIMLVDLARNDLGRVCAAGTVKVTRFMEVEKYSHVMHLVSQVEGLLRPECGNYELMRASFPAGTVIGAPKVRASEIIAELESDRRGPYAGAIGYLSYLGDMDTCLAIRTIVIRDGYAAIQAGAGIVADSEPEREYEETRQKARAPLKAVRMAGEAFK